MQDKVLFSGALDTPFMQVITWARLYHKNQKRYEKIKKSFTFHETCLQSAKGIVAERILKPCVRRKVNGKFRST
ncbi:hypothetical protein TPCCA_0749 [Treponema paraluiscuniculi Cuniculi A]|uniref:Uncharacterized protein n=2 Tax=Treponema paraluiscuniculi TaxID=53435 RepID=F7XRG0_TREPU|nr:hypothetical protein [Treponema paraluiscuniculi]AEH40678.1 hypothetical protein TPCCA_0749 [Treponema paraluiscuniculi Cuniculi A]WKC72607.1 hypothetical protein TPLL2_0749 [Treponema paraluiscuniculi]